MLRDHLTVAFQNHFGQDPWDWARSRALEPVDLNVYDPKQDVRDASGVALARLRQAQAQAQAQLQAQAVATESQAGYSTTPVRTTRVPSLRPTTENVPPPPTPGNGR